MEKSADAFRTISEVAEDLALPQHVLRFWETRFPQIRPLKRAGGRRYYRPADVGLLRTIRELLYDDGYTIKGVQRLLKEQGAKGLGAGAALADSARAVMRNAADLEEEPVDEETVEISGVASGHATLAHLDAAHADAILGGRERHLVESALATVNECRRILDTVLRPAR